MDCGDARSIPFPTPGSSGAPPALPFSTFHLSGGYHPPALTYPSAGPLVLTRCRDCKDGALFTLGVSVCEAGPGAGGCSCSTL